MTMGGMQPRTHASEEYAALRARLVDNPTPDPKDVERVVQLIQRNEELWHCASAASDSAREHVMRAIGGGEFRVMLRAEVGIIKRQLDYDRAAPLEKLVIDHIITAKLRVLYAEDCLNARVVGKEFGVGEAGWWDRFLTSAHNRYLRAVETLARVRRLSRVGPLLQVNIAHEGSRQLNIQGELFAHPGTPQPGRDHC